MVQRNSWWVVVAAMAAGGCALESDETDGGLDTSELGADAGADATSEVPEVVTTKVHARFEVEGDGFYRMPWPNDVRRTAAGFVDLSDFPDPGVDLLRNYVAAVESHVQGFSIMPVVYVALDADPIPTTPVRPVQSLSADGPVQLIDVSAEGCGARVPIEVKMNTAVDDIIGENVLVAAPVPGFVLRPATPYAFVVRTSFGNPDGFSIEPAPESVAALAGTHASPAINAAFAQAATCLPSAGVPLDTIAVATAFTAQDPVRELRALRDHAANTATGPSVTAFAYSDADSRAAYRVFRGTYDTPMYQTGTSPYTSTGGDIEFGGDGAPIQTRVEEVPFTVAVPGSGDGPFRLMIWVDGTGADETSWLGSRLTQALLAEGFAIASYVAQFHGARATPGSDEELNSFNYLNPAAFRNCFRQQVADTAYFLRLMTTARDQMEGLPAIDDDRVVYGGQSQGSLIGSMFASVEPGVHAYMLNGVAAYLSTVAVSRKDPFDIQELISNLTGIAPDFDRFHPFMALAQLGGDATDPHSFAPYWTGWSGDRDGVDILLVNGIDDTTSSLPAMNALAIAGGVPPVAPPGWAVDPFGVWDVEPAATPIADNRVALDGSARTQAVIMSESTGHFTVYDRADVRETAVGFLDTAAGGAAIVR